jgi:hypothetical protein
VTHVIRVLLRQVRFGGGNNILIATFDYGQMLYDNTGRCNCATVLERLPEVGASDLIHSSLSACRPRTAFLIEPSASSASGTNFRIFITTAGAVFIVPAL